MASYRLRVQLQQGQYENIGSKSYDDSSPCTKAQAKSLLSQLEDSGRNYFSTQQWKDKLSEAIGSAKGWVSRASSIGSQTRRTAATFEYDRYTYRVDIEVLAGEGHLAS